MKGQSEDTKKESMDAPSTLQIVGDNAAGVCPHNHFDCASHGSKLVPIKCLHIVASWYFEAIC